MIYDQEAAHKLLAIAISKPSLVDKPAFASLFLHGERALADVLTQLRETGQPFDAKIVTDRDAKAGVLYQQLEHAGASVETTAYLLNRMETMRDRRHVVELTQQYHAKAVDWEGDGTELVAQFETDVMRVATRAENKTPSKVELAKELIRQVEWRAKNPGKTMGVAFGFERMCEAMDGLKAGELVVVAARPGVGKTSILLEMMQTLELQPGQLGLIYSYEMSALQLVDRMVAYRAQMPLRPSADGAWTKAQLTALTKAAGSVASDQTLLLDDEHVPIDVLCGKIRRYVRDQGVRVVGIDYLTQIPASEKYKGNKRMETTEVSNKLRVLAKELQISIVLLSQLSRAQDVYDKELDEYVQPRPKMSSLKETSAIEEDAHVIIGIHRDDRIDPNSAEAIFLKNRAGQCPLIRMTFKGATYTFSER